MAKFCFVSFAQPGHCDFGGLSYVRTAAELQTRGHEVQWVLSRHPREDLNVRARKIITSFRLHSEEFAGLHIRSEEVVAIAKNFARYLKSCKYDCMVVDRLCVGAVFSAHIAKLPWATAGTDGREWTKKSLRPFLNKGVFPGTWDASPISKTIRLLYGDDFPKPSDKSMWATSPFLNISFFPKAYYQDTQDFEHPKHSHFVGCGTVPEPIVENEYLLVTLGNVFNPSVRQKLLKILRPLIRELSIKVLFLAGNMDVANNIQQTFRHDSGVEIKEWLPYDQAYRGAVGVIGHGGTSHIWYGLREGKPLLAVPLKADQFYGALQLERLNVGRNVIPFVVPWYPSRLIQKISGHIPRKVSVYIGKRELSTKFHELLVDSAMRDSCTRLSRIMRVGAEFRPVRP